MCLTKVYYNTYSDGIQDITEKTYSCRDGRGCSHPEVRKYDRRFPFTKLGEVQPESHRSLSERRPTPYFSSHTPRGHKSPSPSGERDSGVYTTSGATKASKHYDYHDPYSIYDPYGSHHRSSKHDPRDRYDRDRDREPRIKRSSTMPHIVYLDRDKSSRSRSRSSSRDYYSRDIPLGPVPLADEYGRRHSAASSSTRSRSCESSDHNNSGGGGSYSHHHSHHHRRRTDDPLGYVVVDDQDERRRRERHRRMSTASYTEPSYDAAAAASSSSSSHRYVPRRASTVVHHGDVSSSSAGARPKQLRWEDQVRARRERQNAEIASRPAPGEPKGILKNAGGSGKGKGREGDDIAALRRAVERMEIPRGRDREPRGRDDWDRARGRYDDEPDRERRKRSKVWLGDDLYKYL